MKYKIQRSFWSVIQDNHIFFQSDWKQKRYSIKIKKTKLVFDFFNDLKRLPSFTQELFFKKAQNYELSFETSQSLFDIFLKKNIIIKTYIIKAFQEQERYSRQEAFFSNFEQSNKSGRELNLILQRKKILIIGLGGYGTWSTLLCARMGIKNLVLVDGDKIELSNLNRQVLFDEQDVGKLKTDVAKKKIEAIDSSIVVKIYSKYIENDEELEKVLIDNQIDFVLNAFGYIPIDSKVGTITHIINRVCNKVDVPCLNYNGSWIGPITDGRSNNYFRFIERTKIKEVIERSMPTLENSYVPAFAPRISICSSIAIWECVRFLIGDKTSDMLRDKVIMLDTIRYKNHYIFEINK